VLGREHPRCQLWARAREQAFSGLRGTPFAHFGSVNPSRGVPRRRRRENTNPRPRARRPHANRGPFSAAVADHCWFRRRDASGSDRLLQARTGGATSGSTPAASPARRSGLRPSTRGTRGTCSRDDEPARRTSRPQARATGSRARSGGRPDGGLPGAATAPGGAPRVREACREPDRRPGASQGTPAGGDRGAADRHREGWMHPLRRLAPRSSPSWRPRARCQRVTLRSGTERPVLRHGRAVPHPAIDNPMAGDRHARGRRRPRRRLAKREDLTGFAGPMRAERGANPNNCYPRAAYRDPQKKLLTCF